MEIDMRNSIIFTAVIFFTLALFWSSSISARDGHRHYGSHHYRYDHYRPYRDRGLYFGFPYVSYSYIHTSPRVIIKEVEEPIVYIEKNQDPVSEPLGSPETDASTFWYYCKKPAGYYPTIERCPDGWMQVVPHKPSN